MICKIFQICTLEQRATDMTGARAAVRWRSQRLTGRQTDISRAIWSKVSKCRDGRAIQNLAKTWEYTSVACVYLYNGNTRTAATARTTTIEFRMEMRSGKLLPLIGIHIISRPESALHNSRWKQLEQGTIHK